MNTPLQQVYVVLGTDAMGGSLRHETADLTEAKKAATLMAAWTKNPASIERCSWNPATDEYVVKEVVQ